MSSKLLDYIKPGKKSNASAVNCEEPLTTAPVFEPVPAPELQHVQQAQPQQVQPQQVQPQHVPKVRIPKNFPQISKWLEKCEEDIERGCDNHKYSELAPVFSVNGCTRLDDITRLSTDVIRTLATEAGLKVTIGLVNRIHEYAVSDVAKINAGESLVFL